jgi:hypothetical protein
MKRNVQYDRQKPGSDEILSRRNFDALLDQYNQQSGKVVKMPSSRRYVWMAAAAAAVALLAVVFFYNDESTEKAKGNPPLVNNPSSDKDSLAMPVAAGLPAPVYNILRASTSVQTVVDAGNGVRITVPANSLADASGAPVSGEVELRYRRLADPVDLFLADIPMSASPVSASEAYESAEMVEMLAFQNGKPLTLRKGQEIEVELPAVQGFSTYSLETASASWIPVQLSENTATATPGEFLPIEALSAARRAEYDALLEQQRIEEYRITAPLLPALPAAPKAADPRKNRFNVDFNTSEFPEMADWRNVVFEVDESARRFDPAIYSVQWEDVKLIRGTQDGRYQIRLSKGQRVEKIDVYPVLEGQSLKVAQDEYNTAVEKRQQLLDNQQTQLNTLRARIAEKCNALRRADALLPKAETGKTQKSFRSGHFGIFATLRKIAWPASVRTTALNLLRPDGTTLTASRIVHVQQGTNSIFSWQGSPLAFNFSYNAEMKNQLWVIADNTLWWAPADRFTSPKPSGIHITLMPVPADAATSAGALRNFFGI